MKNFLSFRFAVLGFFRPKDQSGGVSIFVQPLFQRICYARIPVSVSELNHWHHGRVKVKAKFATNPRFSEIDSTIRVLAKQNKKMDQTWLQSEIIKHQFDEFGPRKKLRTSKHLDIEKKYRIKRKLTNNWLFLINIQCARECKNQSLYVCQFTLFFSLCAMEYLISENALISEETLLRFDWQGIKFKKICKMHEIVQGKTFKNSKSLNCFFLIQKTVTLQFSSFFMIIKSVLTYWRFADVKVSLTLCHSLIWLFKNSCFKNRLFNRIWIFFCGA